MSLRARLDKLERTRPTVDPLKEADRAFVTRWLATRDEAAELALEYEEQREAAGSHLAMYGSDEGRAVIFAMLDSMNEME